MGGKYSPTRELKSAIGCCLQNRGAEHRDFYGSATMEGEGSEKKRDPQSQDKPYPRQKGMADLLHASNAKMGFVRKGKDAE